MLAMCSMYIALYHRSNDKMSNIQIEKIAILVSDRE